MNPLPLVDGAFFIDNSTLELLTTCPRALEYSRLFRRISSRAKPALDFGSAIHLAFDWRYRNCGNNPPDALEESEQCRILADFFAAHPVPEDEHRNLNWAVEVIKHYNQTYQVEPFNVLVDKDGQPLVEMPFALRLFDWHNEDHTDNLPTVVPVYYSGRIDLPVAWDNQVVVIDHKTTSVLGDFFFKEQRISPQQVGYCWAFEQITGTKVNAFCINAIRSREAPARHARRSR